MVLNCNGESKEAIVETVKMIMLKDLSKESSKSKDLS
jgi:hypothetical protein